MLSQYLEYWHKERSGWIQTSKRASSMHGVLDLVISVTFVKSEESLCFLQFRYDSAEPLNLLEERHYLFKKLVNSSFTFVTARKMRWIPFLIISHSKPLAPLNITSFSWITLYAPFVSLIHFKADSAANKLKARTWWRLSAKWALPQGFASFKRWYSSAIRFLIIANFNHVPKSRRC